ncbi:alpha-D-ribose 1-methylphosphonate 5-triphosphate synthase subunit PhnG [Aliiroseovarius halocynthiae]|uniref:Phosphonate C-P lyase system protein PhnG n=1 Tax=Aliiroseovarius halocynthiae TaxID=985055 RepID=A0A545SQY6_9RHOB|nr:phosphonate C-P lyase system protein PhnG [Aliiroseovarius halocynthiae]TQV67377.1 phosphonate C-P lyase system protein PhnG [Aliiroseovarius halocynthiae]SMR81302.1 alpha-D-ribose 1-methylphosphonate 5-triphosphate synthase subunit PhnG [Aliiroseovarius halocynthiae]
MDRPHSEILSILARSKGAALKAFGETLIPQLGDIDVQKSQTGLVMLPMRDTAQGTAFHLGEVLVSEAQIKRGDLQGYGMRKGRDLEAAMAMALVDLAMQSDMATEDCHAFVSAQKQLQDAEDHTTLCEVEATRVDMETF